MKRVLIKLSGEALAGEKKTGYDDAVIEDVGRQIKTIVDSGCDAAVVIGGGNYWRGRSTRSIDRTKSDQIGMLATVMNCIYVSEIFRLLGLKTVIMTPFPVGTFTEEFSKDRVNRYFAEQTVVFFAGGTGHPYFSTDTGTVLRAIEIDADSILLAKAVDGVYSADPKSVPDAVKYDTISLDEVVAKKLQVVDLAASVLALENKMPMAVFRLGEKDGIIRAAQGKTTGTVITV